MKDGTSSQELEGQKSKKKSRAFPPTKKKVLKRDNFARVFDTSCDKISADKSYKKGPGRWETDNVYPEAGWSCETRRSVFEFRYPGRDRFRRSIESDHVLTSGSATTLRPSSKKWKKVQKSGAQTLSKRWWRRGKWWWRKKRTTAILIHNRRLVQQLEILIWRFERLKWPSFVEVRKKLKRALWNTIKEHFCFLIKKTFLTFSSILKEFYLFFLLFRFSLIFIKSPRSEALWVRKNGFYARVCLSVSRL